MKHQIKEKEILAFNMYQLCVLKIMSFSARPLIFRHNRRNLNNYHFRNYLRYKTINVYIYIYIYIKLCLHFHWSRVSILYSQNGIQSSFCFVNPRVILKNADFWHNFFLYVILNKDLVHTTGQKYCQSKLKISIYDNIC